MRINMQHKCSIFSPCNKSKVCNLNKNKCESPSIKETVYIKGNGFTGDKHTVADRIKQAYAHVIKNAKCDWGMDIISLEDYTGQEYKKLQDSLEDERLLGFYDPNANKILCQAKNNLVNYWKSKKNTFKGIVLNSREHQILKEEPAVSRVYKQNKEQEYFIPLSPLLPTIYINQKQVDNVLNENYSFFILLPTNMKWIDTKPPTISAYHNFNPERGEYGDVVYIIIPIVTKSKRVEIIIRDLIEKYGRVEPWMLTRKGISKEEYNTVKHLLPSTKNKRVRLKQLIQRRSMTRL